MEIRRPQEFLGVPAVLESPAIQQVMTMAKRVAASPVAVLITGETGSGKEIVARAIHHFSLRCAKPWVDINCGALPEQLMESELFGHEKGAFSGADTAKPGLFEMAHSGTLFLDEVGELDARLQVKLLRVLDGTPYYRVGGQRKVSADVRIVAATNQELEQHIAAGRFRSDLFHRLNQFRIRVPPLRERMEDIIPLAEYFLKLHSAKAVLCDDAHAALKRYSWPGNVRELRNAVAHATIASGSYDIHAQDLPLLHAPAAVAATAGQHTPGGLGLDGIERDAILQALGRTGGHHQKAANLLGISRRTLSRKLKAYRLQEEEVGAHSG
jgi:transcriptional regulator with PAS, ATPase and Fis domain